MRNQNRSNRKSNLSTVSESIQELLKAYRIERKFDATQLTSSWEKLMGEPIAKRTNKLFVKNRTLFVELNSAALKHELNLSKSKIMTIFEEEFGRKLIDDIVFL